jgi:hypothetical protein
MSNVSLPVSLIIDVTVLPTPAVLGEVNINTATIYTNNQPSGWAGGQTYALYNGSAQVGIDFGINSSAFAMAVAFFAQTPNPVGTEGYLAIVPLLQSPSVETVRAGIARIGQSFYYYGILIDNELAASNPTEFGLLVADIQSLGNMLGYCSSNINDLNPGSPLDLVRQAGEYRGRMFYYGGALLNGAAVQQTQIFSAAYLSRLLSVNFTGVGTAITMNGKQLVGIVPDATVGLTQLALAQTAGIDVYVNIGTPMVYCSGANQWADQVYNTDAFSQNLQVGGFNYLIPVAFKIPQTDSGVQGLCGAYRAVCSQFVTNGVLAPGAWTGAVPAGFPQALFLANIAAVGYYVYAQPVASQTQAARNGRSAPLVQIAAKFAGAVQSSQVVVQLQQ